MVLGVLTVAVLGFCYLEPVKALRLFREVRGWRNSFTAPAVERTATITDYAPVALTGRYPLGDAHSRPVHRRLMDSTDEYASESALGKVSVYLDGQRRHAIAGTAPFDFSYRVRVPTEGQLWFALNHEDGGSHDGELIHEVLVSSGAGTESVYRLRVPVRQHGWKDASVDLGAFAGRDVTIRFKTSVESGSREPVKAYWSNLILRSKTNAAERPNISVILIDTLRADHLGSYGYARATSPSIDRLAAKGVRFEHAYSAASWTNPSVLALFTGRYPSDAWEPKPHSEAIKLAMPTGADTMAEILAANGYVTVAASDHPGVNYKLFGQGFDTYLSLLHIKGPGAAWGETDSDNVLAQLHTLLEGQPNTGLFTYIHLIYPHHPYEPPPPFDDMFGRGTLRFRRSNRDSIINMYDGDIRHTDEVIKQLVADMEVLGIGKDSITVLLSDHGEGFWEHDLWEHGNSLYNELLHIPLIFHAPGRIPENKTIRELVRSVDVLPTILDLVGIGYDEHNFRGESLLPLMRDGAANGERIAFSEFPYTRIVLGRSIQSLTEKVIHTGLKGKALDYYEIGKDPGEHTNLGASRYARASEWLDAMDEITRTASQSRMVHVPVVEDPSEDTVEKLRALGYTE
jgi:arylsulfatase A-like enzyme